MRKAPSAGGYVSRTLGAGRVDVLRRVTVPEEVSGGAFITFQGSANRAPEPEAGYNVVFQPFTGAKPSGAYEVFADGFAGVTPVMKQAEAKRRPGGLAQAPDGSIYISDLVGGRIWRVIYPYPRRSADELTYWRAVLGGPRRLATLLIRPNRAQT